MSNQYSKWIGIKKSIKNVAIVWGIPALILLLDNWTEWIPNNYQKAAIPIIAFIAYFIKNYVQNK